MDFGQKTVDEVGSWLKEEKFGDKIVAIAILKGTYLSS